MKRLEDGLGRLLLQRHPRLVRLTAEGERFLPAARELMAAHGKALAAFAVAPEHIAVGISEQAVGAEVPAVLARLTAHDPGIVINLRIEPSRMLEEAFERGELDVVIVRRLAAGRTGEVPVSYTHLDVYKRQLQLRARRLYFSPRDVDDDVDAYDKLDLATAERTLRFLKLRTKIA